MGRIDLAFARGRRLRRAWPRAALLLAAVLPVLCLVGCGGGEKRDMRLADVPGAKPRHEPKARLGNMDSYVVFGKTYRPKPSSRGHVETGIASWYGPKFHGKKTSSGEPYDMHAWTAAHKTLPLPTYALVTNLENDRSIIVKINDRGPFVGDRIIDLSYTAAKALGVDKQGTARVRVTSIDPRDHDGQIPKKLRLAAADAEPEPTRSKTKRASKPPAAVRRPPAAVASSAEVGRIPRSSAAEPMRSAASSAPAPGAQPTLAHSGARYFLQVGAFGTRANAEQMRRRLGGRLAAPVLIADDTVGAGIGAAPVFRVRVGPVGSRAAAERLVGELAALGVGASLVLPR